MQNAKRELDVHDILRRLDSVSKTSSGWTVSCPVPSHGKGRGDKNPSLSVSKGMDGTPLLKCHAGCSFENIMDALNLDTSPANPSISNRKTGDIKVAYNYHDQDGIVLFQVVRKPEKKFLQRRPDENGEWEWGRGDIEPVPYRLPEVLEADDGVYIAEGEKDVESLRERGLVATCNPGGAGNWRDEFARYFDGRDVVILPDNDAPGRKHARKVTESLEGVTSSVRIVELPGLSEGEDVSDWLMQGHTVEELKELVEQTVPEDAPTALSVRSFDDVEREQLDKLWNGRLFGGKLGILGGNMEEGKSTILCDLAARYSTRTPLPGQSERPERRLRTLFLSAEDDPGDTIKPRLMTARAAEKHVFVVDQIQGDEDPRPPSLPEDIPSIVQTIKQNNIGLVVVDPLSAYLTGNVDSYRDSDVRRVLHPLSKLAEDTGAAVICVKHFTKSGHMDAQKAVGGSVGFMAAARFAWVAGKDPKDEDRRVLAMAKSNLAIKPPSLEFQLVPSQKYDCARVQWNGQSEVTADEIAEEKQPETKIEVAKDLLRDELGAGPKSASDLYEIADERGITKRTMRRAADQMEVQKKKDGFQGSWEWSFPANKKSGQNGNNDDNGPVEGDSAKADTSGDVRFDRNPNYDGVDGENAKGVNKEATRIRAEKGEPRLDLEEGTL